MNWPTVRLSDICDTQYGYTASAQDVVAGPKFLRITDIMKPSIEWSSVPHCQIDEAKISKYCLRKGDIVVARTGYPGHAKLIRDDVDAVFASYLVRITIDESVANPQYIGHLLESPVYRRFVDSVKSGVAQANANARTLTLFPFQLPPLDTQTRIADILDQYDDLIKNNRRRIQLLEQSARLLYKEWFVHLRFPGHERATITDGVPEGWEKKLLGDVANITMGQSPKSIYYNEDGDGLPFHQGVTNFGVRFPSDKTYCRIQKRLAEPGDILFSVRAPVGEN